MNIGDVILYLLNASTSLHILHFKSKSYSEHVTLGDLYSGLEDLVDSLTEEYQGVNGVITEYTMLSTMIPTNTIEFVKSIKSFVDTNRKVFGPQSHIQNTVDEIQTLLATSIYKLENLK